jgi:large subunit ribosomal protein L6
MVLGVTKGWKRSLELNGVGFVAKVQGHILTLTVGFSHDVKMDLPKTVKCTVNKNQIELECPDKELLGTIAAKIRKVKPPEPYLGKGIKFTDEVIRRKAGKTGKK